MGAVQLRMVEIDEVGEIARGSGTTVGAASGEEGIGGAS